MAEVNVEPVPPAAETETMAGQLDDLSNVDPFQDALTKAAQIMHDMEYDVINFKY